MGAMRKTAVMAVIATLAITVAGCVPSATKVFRPAPTTSSAPAATTFPPTTEPPGTTTTTTLPTPTPPVSSSPGSVADGNQSVPIPGGDLAIQIISVPTPSVGAAADLTIQLTVANQGTSDFGLDVGRQFSAGTSYINGYFGTVIQVLQQLGSAPSGIGTLAPGDTWIGILDFPLPAYQPSRVSFYASGSSAVWMLPGQTQ